VGLAAVDLVTRRRALDSVPARLVVGGGAGLATGLVVAALILAGYGTGSALVVLASGVGSAALLGGLACAVRPAGIVGAAITGTLAWFLLGLLQGVFNDRLLSVF